MTKTDVILIRNANQFDFGGAEKYQILLAQELAQNGLHATIVSGHQQLLNSAKQSNLPTVKSPWLKHQNFASWRIILTPLYFLWQIRLYCFYQRLFKAHQPQIVHIHSRDDFIAGTLAAHHLGIKVFWTDHADLKHIFHNTQVRFKNPIGKTILKLVAKIQNIIFISHFEQNTVVNLPLRSLYRQTLIDKAMVIYNGSLDHKPDSAQSAHHEFRFAFLGRVVRDKGINEIITAFTSLTSQHANLSLWIIGDGELLSTLPRTDHIKFFGLLDNPYSHLAQINCLLAPSYHEGLGMSIIDGCMMQKTIIATNTGGIPEIITDQHNGLLIPPRDAEALEQAMLKIINQPGLARQLASQARQTFEQKFNFTKIVHDQIIPLYFPEDDTIKS